ncbi:MAG: SUMF1/EgtB/PvdO family nonheme iron enzyme [Bacteroidia bacterium]|nr:SUMF1/EgtB/PvdO family nonheme iron enzyme [Bacteroidia bacterium]
MKRNIAHRAYYALSCLLLLFFTSSLHANNVEVSNVSLTGQNTTDQTVQVQFDLAWENSWRISVGPSNWDAAWVFVKFRPSGGDWQHASLNFVDGIAANDGHLEAAGSVITTPSDGRGAFIYRDADGSGDVSYSDLRLLWNYGSDGVADGQLVDIQVFAIEMVYIPQGSFRLGDGAGSTSAGKFRNGILAVPYTVSSENAINVSNTIGNLYYSSVIGSGDQLGPIPAAFPKGFNAFYCMKYEVSQGQYVDFFNTLTTSQKTDRDITNSNHKNSDTEVARNTISYTSGSATSSSPDRALNYVSNQDVLAYLDWSGLRLMTELEFEKACRGTQLAVPDEFAWGSADIYSPASNYSLSNDGTPAEGIADPGSLIGNAMYSTTAGSIGGPVRCGIFAASAINKSREESGGTYYGIMEMSGNVYERAVTVGSPAGRVYTALHGDGNLTVSGEHNVTGWPAYTGSIGYRGGGYLVGSSFARVSDRDDAATASNIVNNRVGFRAVRSAP